MMIVAASRPGTALRIDPKKSARVMDTSTSKIEFLVVAENAALVEGDSAVAFEIGLDVRPLRDPVVQIGEAGNFLLEGLHPLWKRIAQSLDDLKQREIGVTEPSAGEIAAAGLVEHVFEIAEIFRHALIPELLGAFLGGRT